MEVAVSRRVSPGRARRSGVSVRPANVSVAPIRGFVRIVAAPAVRGVGFRYSDACSASRVGFFVRMAASCARAGVRGEGGGSATRARARS